MPRPASTWNDRQGVGEHAIGPSLRVEIHGESSIKTSKSKNGAMESNPKRENLYILLFMGNP